MTILYSAKEGPGEINRNVYFSFSFKEIAAFLRLKLLPQYLLSFPIIILIFIVDF